jgi:cell wall-associated NlpC family hydrolase
VNLGKLRKDQVRKSQRSFGGFSRGIVVVVTGLTVLTVGITADVAADPTTADGALKLYRELSEQASATNDAALTAQSDYQAKLVAQKAADATVVAAKAEVAKVDARRAELQPFIDAVVRANYMGGRTNRMFALLVSGSPQELLDQMSTLELINRDVFDTVARFAKFRADARTATDRADRAQHSAADASAAAAKVQADLKDKKSRLAAEVNRIKALYDRLTGRQRAELGAGSVPFDPSTLPPGVDANAVRVAVSKTGSPYSWGAAGPGQFDCSGLMMWAYKQVGKNIPRTSQAQLAGGTRVPRDQLRPGDIIVYYAGATHVGMYVGNGKVVHAPTYGVPVQVVPIDAAGPYNTAVRY